MLKQLVAAVASVIAVGIASTAAAASAPSGWLLIGEVDGTAVQFDAQNVVVNGKVAGVTLRSDLKRAQKSDNGKRFVTGLSDAKVDCEKDLLQEGHSQYFDDKGRLVDETDDAEWHKATSGTFSYRMIRVVCGYAGAKVVKGIDGFHWQSMPAWRGSAFNIAAAMDAIEEIGRDQISVLVVTEFKDWQFDGKSPYRFRMDEYWLDCRQEAATAVASSYFATATRLVREESADPNKLTRTPITAKSIFAPALEELCSAPRVAPRRAAVHGGEGAGLSFGTAWATNKGYLVTASHVVTGGGKIELYQDGKKIGVAELVANDQANDVALLKFVPAGGAKLKMIPLADRPGALGRPVFTLGFPAPDVMGQRVKMSKGDIAATSGIQDDARFLQISMPIQQGNSGGPVVGFDGAAVGVVSAKLTRLSDEDDSPKPENVNYAVKTSYLKPLLDELPDLGDYVAIKAAGLSQEDLVAQVSQAVYMVVVSQ